MLTLTVPHVIASETLSVVRRVRVLEKAFGRFWRLLADEIRPELAAIGSGVSTEDAETGEVDALYTKGHKRKGVKKRPIETQRAGIPDNELSLWDLVHHLWVREWTPGEDDGLGHPHLHVWMFGPYVDHAKLVQFWKQALEQASALPLGCDPIVHIEAAKPGIENELVKYLTKEWEVVGDSALRVRPEVFAQLYSEIDGRRSRQTSQGLSTFAVEKIVICPCCHYEPKPGRHWAIVEFEFQGKTEREHLAERSEHATGPPGERAGPGLAATSGSLEAELRARYWAERDAAWLESIELRILRGNWRPI